MKFRPVLAVAAAAALLPALTGAASLPASTAVPGVTVATGTIVNAQGQPMPGVAVALHAGYDTDAALSYHFSRAGHLCGTNAYPGQTPKRLVARR
jgi:hypothetical protein